MNRLDIVAVIERYVPLKRAGSNYVACCPFHTEKSPSFTVSAAKQFYHCFGCGAHGTAIGFVMEYSGTGFIDAVKDLAQMAGMQVPEYQTERSAAKSAQGDDLAGALLKAARYYRTQLKEAPQAIEYLRKRGLSGEIAKEFGIGYAPEGWQNLQTALADCGPKAMIAAGLVIEAEGGKRYDRFRDRIMFPIVDQRGQIIGFGGRILERGEPKYLNSPETPLFEKGRELYGLYQARRAIREAKRALVVEGYMDVVALAQHGIGYAVATLGTATTPTHLQKLLRQTDEIVFCFDGDAAGRRAAWRALENSLDQLVDGKQLSFLFLPQGDDPDSYVRKSGKDAFEALFGQALPLSQYLIKELSSGVDLATPEGRAKLLEAARPLVKRISAPLLGLMLRKQLAQTAGVSQQELDAQFQVKPTSSAPAERSAPAARHSARPAAQRKAPTSILRSLIGWLMLHPQLARLAEREALADGREMSTLDQAELATLDRLLEAAQREETVVSWVEYFRGTEQEQLLRQIELALLTHEVADWSSQETEREFVDGWAQLCEQMRRGQLDLLTEKWARQKPTREDEERYRRLSQQKPHATQK